MTREYSEIDISGIFEDFNRQPTLLDYASPSRHVSKVCRDDKGESVLHCVDDYVCFDVETTGLSPSDEEIIEFGAVRVRGGEVVDHFSELCNPGRSVPPEVSRITGITDAMLADARPVAAVLGDFLAFVGESPVVGYNVGFDVNFVYDSSMRHYGRPFCNDMIDAKRFVHRAVKLPSYKLGAALDHYGITNARAHRAIHDAEATQILYERLKGFCYGGDVLPECAVLGAYRPEAALTAIQTMCDDDENVTLRQNTKDCSVLMFGGLAFRVVLNSRSRCLLTTIEEAQPFIGAAPCIVDGGQDRVRVNFAADPSERDAVTDLVRAVYAELKSRVTGPAFGCCNSFILCSDARRCLHENDVDYVGCQYRQNLEAGRIFYGKNRNV